jgi:long-chain acyl-CoA synthetase
LEDIDPALFETAYTDLIRPVFKKFPDKTACAYFGRHVSYAELDREANRFAHMLLARGFQKGDVLGISLPNMPEYLFAWLGTLRAGCAVSGVSPLLSTQQVAYQLRDGNAKGFVTLDIFFADKVQELVAQLENLRLIVTAKAGSFLPGFEGKVTPIEGRTVYTFEEILQEGKFPTDEPGVKITPDDIAYLQYTGGTTGVPKGAMLSHRNSVADLLIYQKWLGWKEGEVTALCGFPFFHIAGIFVNANGIYLGGLQILIPNPRDTDHMCAEMEKYKPTLLVNVPALYQLLMAKN